MVEAISNTDCHSLSEFKNEGIYLQSMLKANRLEQHFLDNSSPLSETKQATFQEILDGDYGAPFKTQKLNNSQGTSSQKIGVEDAQRADQVLSLQSSIVTNNINNPIKSVTALNKPSLIVETSASDFSKKNSSSKLMMDFVKSIWPKAKQAALLIGLDPKILVAQAALETGWGQFVAKDTDGSTSNNLFNIKSGTNNIIDSVQIKTTEYIADLPIQVNAHFRKYPSVEHSLNDYVSLIKWDKRYQGALAETGNPENYVHELNKAGYATDPNYSNKILSIYHSDQLQHAIDQCEA